MKRTIPLLITFLTGLILIVAWFIPYTQDWNNDVLVWFEILASIAFVLGGGNLLMMHLKTISDRPAGWGYSLVTLVAFVVTLIVGSIKLGSPPEPNSERYGQTAAVLRLHDFPEEFDVPGRIPDETLPGEVKGQLVESPDPGTISFRGWMTSAQRSALEAMDYEADWHRTVAQLAEKAQPPAVLKDVSDGEPRIKYQAQLERLFFVGVMSDGDRDELLKLSDNDQWVAAVQSIHSISNLQHSVPFESLPNGYTIPEPLRGVVTYDSERKRLVILGPMSVAARDQLEYNFPKGSIPSEAERKQLQAELESLGPFPSALVDALGSFNKEAATIGLRNRDLLFELLRTAEKVPGAGLNGPQRQLLLADYDAETKWRIAVGELFAAAHQEKFPFSGKYDFEGSAIWYIYEFGLNPLTATMFSLLAFYVASAAYRAFRAKNVEATLLLVTAFIVLLGRTYLGTWLTSWMPERLSGLTIPELTVLIMAVFTTAGNRAIMIGIALGVVSTSLKILLGIDRSYLGSDRE